MTLVRPAGVLVFLLSISTLTHAQPDGEALFNQNCASCHEIDKPSTGPALLGARQRWADAGEADMIYTWVKNWSAAVASGSPYAKQMSSWSPTQMNMFGALSNEDIDAIFDYVDAGPGDQPPGGEKVLCGDEVEGGDGDEAGGIHWAWWLLLIINGLIIFAVVGVRRQLANETRKAEGKTEIDEDASYMDTVREWAWKNKGFVGIFGLVATIGLMVWLSMIAMGVGVYDNYKPEQPIAFRHDLHAGLDEIACQYCHNGVEKSKTAGIPTVNVCMNCHKSISEGTCEESGEKIATIYEHAGFDPNTATFTGDSKPIKWTKVHVLPDHVFFSHRQHVVVGGVDCQQCHGDMTKETVARVVPVEELSALEGNIKLTRPTLTMGWCIECHNAKNIDTENSGDYYAEIHRRLKKDKALLKKYLNQNKTKEEGISVGELGGLECAKCHY